MGLRYVWEKWSRNTNTTTTYSFEKTMVSGSVIAGLSSFWSLDGSSISVYNDDTAKANITIDSNTGEITLSGDPKTDTIAYATASGVYFECGYQAAYGKYGSLQSVVGHPQYHPTANGSYYKYDAYGRDKKTYSKGTTSYGYISSASSGAYPTNSYSGSYWYVLQGNDTIDPSAVSYGTPHGGELLDIVVTPSASITYGGTVKYKYEISTDGGSTWSEENAGTTATTISVLIPAGVETFQARVTASDNMGFKSTDAVAGEVLTVINNTAPVITCATSALGEIAAPFNVAYSVSDADGNTMTITEKIDGAVIRSYATTGGEGTLTIDADRLLRTLNGAHTLTITADDGNGGVTTHSITFVKAVYTATITRAEPMDADDRIAIMVMHVVGSIPADADYKVEVTNNALDASPVWEDVTSYIKNDNIKNYSFANTTCTSGTWAFNFRVTVSRGSSGVGGYITSLDGAFEGSVA